MGRYSAAAPPGWAPHVHGRGVVVERGSTAQILDDPQHSYTQWLRASVPRPGWKPARRG